jgi:hypothetical protein
MRPVRVAVAFATAIAIEAAFAGSAIGPIWTSRAG